MTAVFRQVQGVIDQVIAAVEFLFVFTLAAGVLVLYAALASSRDERVREAACCARLAHRAVSCRARRSPRCSVLAAWRDCSRRSARAAIGWALATLWLRVRIPGLAVGLRGRSRRRFGRRIDRRLVRIARSAQHAAAGDAARGIDARRVSALLALGSSSQGDFAMAGQLDEAQDTETSAPVRQPKPPFKKQQQQPPGLESALDPAPRFEAPRYKPAGKLQGQVALITGGDSGIGRAVALAVCARRRRCGHRLPARGAIGRRGNARAASRPKDAAAADARRRPVDAAFCDEVVETHSEAVRPSRHSRLERRASESQEDSQELRPTTNWSARSRRTSMRTCGLRGPPCAI